MSKKFTYMTLDEFVMENSTCDIQIAPVIKVSLTRVRTKTCACGRSGLSSPKSPNFSTRKFGLWKLTILFSWKKCFRAKPRSSRCFTTSTWLGESNQSPNLRSQGVFHHRGSLRQWFFQGNDSEERARPRVWILKHRISSKSLSNSSATAWANRFPGTSFTTLSTAFSGDWARRWSARTCRCRSTSRSASRTCARRASTSRCVPSWRSPGASSIAW